jgi:hypothetical protein
MKLCSRQISPEPHETLLGSTALNLLYMLLLRTNETCLKVVRCLQPQTYREQGGLHYTAALCGHHVYDQLTATTLLQTKQRSTNE